MKSIFNDGVFFAGVALLLAVFGFVALAAGGHVVQDARWWATVISMALAGTGLAGAGSYLKISADKKATTSAFAARIQYPPSPPVVAPAPRPPQAQSAQAGTIHDDIDALNQLAGSLVNHPNKDAVLKPVYDAVYDVRMRTPGASPVPAAANAPAPSTGTAVQ